MGKTGNTMVNFFSQLMYSKRVSISLLNKNGCTFTKYWKHSTKLDEECLEKIVNMTKNDNNSYIIRHKNDKTNIYNKKWLHSVTKRLESQFYFLQSIFM